MWFIVFMSLRIVADLFVNLDEFAEVAEKQGVGTWYLVGQVASYYFYNSLTYFTEMGGIIILVAAAFSLARMNHTNELTAMLASGVSLYRVVWPIILAAMLMGGLIIIDQEFLIPNVKHKLLREGDEIGGIKKGDRVKLLADGYNSVWYANLFDPQEKKLHSPLVLLRDDGFRYTAHAGAKFATFSVFERSPGWLTNNGFLFCKSGDDGKGNVGWRHTQDTSQIYTVINPEELVEIGKKMWADRPENRGKSFPKGKTIGGVTEIKARDKHFNMDLRAEQFKPDVPVYKDVEKTTVGVEGGELIRPRFDFRSKGDDHRVLATIAADRAVWIPGSIIQGHWKLQGGVLFIPSDLTPEELNLRQSSSSGGREYMSSRELTKLLKLKRAGNLNAIRLAKYVRFADPLNNLVLLLLGLPFILSRQLNIKASAVLCLLIVMAFYVFIYICRYLGMPDFFAAFLPLLIFGPTSVAMLDSIKT